jgi:hypothetical protein
VFNFFGKLSTASRVAAKQLIVNQLKWVATAGANGWDFNLHDALSTL